MTDAGMVVIGAGEAGARAASSLRERGYAGRVTLVGDEAHGPYERPPLSKAVMTDADADAAAPTLILDEAKLRHQDIAHVAGRRAVTIDRAGRRVRLDDGSEIAYAKLLIATGASPRRLPVPGADETVLYLRTFADALALRARLRPGRSLVVIGGGFIGLEITASAVARGCSVVLLETAPRILMRGVPERVTDRVAARHRRAGVDLRTGVRIVGLRRSGDGAAVTLQDGTELACDAVVAGIGAVPETALAEAAGLATDNGVAVDATLRTTDPDIWAAGDCCSFPQPLYDDRRVRLEAWRSAQEQGAVAAANMLGAGERFTTVPWFWSDQYEETLQVAGLADAGAAVVERDLGEATLYFQLALDGRLLAVSGIGPNGRIAKEVRLGEMLIARRAAPDPARLADPAVPLKALLAR